MDVIKKFMAVSRLIGLGPYMLGVSVLLTELGSVGDATSMALLVPALNLIAGQPPSPLFAAWLQRAGVSGTHAIVTLLGLVILAVLFTALTQALGALLQARHAVRFVALARQRMAGQLLSYNKAFFDRTDVNLQLSVTLDSSAEIGRLMQLLRPVMAYLAVGSTLVLLLLMMSWQLTLLMLAALPLLYLPVQWLDRSIRRDARQNEAAGLRLRGHLHDVLSNIGLVKASSTEAGEQERLDQLIAAAEQASFRVQSKQATSEPLEDMLNICGLVGVVAIAMLTLLRSGSMSIGLFIVYFFVLRRCVNHLSQFSTARSLLAQMAPPLDRMLWLLVDDEPRRLQDGTRVFEGLRDCIEFREVSFAYGPHPPVLSQLSLTIQQGSKVALIGRTGAGKSTIAHLLARLYDPSSGSIHLDGIDMRDYTVSSLHDRIAIVTQDVLLLNDTMRHNLLYGLRRAVSADELDTALRHARLQGVVAGLPQGLDTPLGERGMRLSGGERQRISIARALLKNPDILILDEATSALDHNTEQLVQAAIDAVMRHRTVLAIAHRHSTLQHADQVYAVEDGYLAAAQLATP
jgi:ABC-type multidrug transport system fused ATPase/permease subunit